MCVSWVLHWLFWFMLYMYLHFCVKATWLGLVEVFKVFWFISTLWEFPVCIFIICIFIINYIHALLSVCFNILVKGYFSYLAEIWKCVIICTNHEHPHRNLWIECTTWCTSFPSQFYLLRSCLISQRALATAVKWEEAEGHTFVTMLLW